MSSSDAPADPNPQDPYATPPYGQQPPPYGGPGYPPAYRGPGYPPPYWQPPYGHGPYGPGYGPPGYGPPGYGPPQYGFGWPAPVPGGRLASMGARLGGLVIDTLILAVPGVIIGLLVGAFHSTETCDATGCSTNVNIGGSLLFDAFMLLIGLAYAAYFVGMKGQTPGHRAVGVRVVDVATGGLIGPGRAMLRWFVLGITGALCTLGYWSPFFDRMRRQGWHDKASNSVVIPSAGH